MDFFLGPGIHSRGHHAKIAAEASGVRSLGSRNASNPRHLLHLDGGL